MTDGPTSHPGAPGSEPHFTPTADSTSGHPRVAPADQAVLREGPGTRIGPYKILQVIGEGGFGTVFLAEQERPVQRRVALKIIKLGMDTRQIVARFEAERQALAMMDHPNIAKVLDAGATETGRPYFVMELVKGIPITQYCDTHNLSIRERLDIFLQVCRAVQHAHHKGVIHRDIKPSNILVASHDDAPQVKVIDFGIAKAADYRLTDKTIFTEFRQMIGTPEYMSPEQTQGGEDIDTRTDVYSLGVVLYELLTGFTPLDGRTLRAAAIAEIQRLIREVEPPKPSTRLSSAQGAAAAVAAHRRTEPRKLGLLLRGDLDWIVMMALDKDRKRRYESPGALARDIEHYLRDEPVTAGPPSASYKLRKFARRHRAGVVIASGFLAMLMAGVVATGIMYRRAELRRGEAEMRRAEADQRRAEVERESAKVHAAYDFVNGMFSSIDPSVAQGREITVREILDTAAAKMGDSLKGQPQVEAAVREAMGEAYHHIGKFDKAQENLRRAMTLRREALGPEHPETLESMNNLAAASLERRETGEAINLLRETIAGRTKALGAGHKDTLASQSLLAYAVQLSGDMEGAEKAIREVIDAQTKALGPTHKDTIESRSSLADILHTVGKEDEAITVCEALVADSLKGLGPDHTLTMDARSIQAAVLKDAGREPEAEAALREIVASKIRVYGADHPSTILSEDVLGNTLRAQKKLDEAEKIERSVVERSKTINGPEASPTLTYMNNLAQTLRMAKKLDEAEALYRQVVETRRRISGANDRDTLIASYNLSLTMLDRQKPADALVLIDEVIAGFQGIMPADHWMIGVVRVSRAEALAGLERFPEAEESLKTGYAAITAKLGPTHWRATTAAVTAAKVYEKWGKPDQAAEWQKKAALK